MVCGGVESICTQLTELGALTPIDLASDHQPGAQPPRARWRTRASISRVHAANYGVYGARSVANPEP